jgi:hypothetical protein
MPSNILRLAICATLALGVRFSAIAGDDTWKTAASGNWEVGANWTDGTVPTMADTAAIAQAGTYTITCGAMPSPIQQLSVSGGANVTMQATAGQLLDVDAAGGNQEIDLAGASTAMTLGAAGLPINISAASHLSVQGGSMLNVKFGSQLSAADLSGAGLNGTVLVDGSGSALTLNAAGQCLVGAGGGSGSLTFQNGSTGSITGALRIADDSAAGTAGSITIGSGAALSLGGNLSLASGNVAGQSATLTVTGIASLLTQSGSSSITVGSATGGAAEIDVGKPGAGAILTTGSGTLTINHTGAVYVGTPFGFTGTLNAGGDIAINGGYMSIDGTFGWTSGKTMSISSGGSCVFVGGHTTTPSAVYNISGAGSTLQVTTNPLVVAGWASVNVTAGGSVSSSANLDVGVQSPGTLLVDGSESSASGGMQKSRWGHGGGSASVTFSHSASGSFPGTVSLAGSSAVGTSAIVNVQSGASVTTGNLWLATAGGTMTSATLTVSDSGSSVRTASATGISVGNSTSGSATINLTSGGTITVGAGGSTTIDHTGTVNVSGGTLNAGTLANSGTLTITTGVVSAGAVTQNSTATLAIGIAGPVRGLQYGTLLASGAATLGGTLSVSLNGYAPALGNYFDFLDFGSRSGTFSSVGLPTLTGTLAWNSDALYTVGVVSVIDTNYFPGNFDPDGNVNVGDVSAMMGALADLSRYKSSNSLTISQLRSLGDLTGDGLVTNADVQGLLNVLAGASAGSSAGQAAIEATAVPEPMSLVLMLIGGASTPLVRCVGSRNGFFMKRDK